MQIRPVTANDLAGVREIDGTVESSRYLHVDTTAVIEATNKDAGESGDDSVDNNLDKGLVASWRLEERPERQKIIDPNRLDDDVYFKLKQVVTGVEEGLALAIDHEEDPIALLLAEPRPAEGTLQIVDLRVDYDYRRQGMGTALLYQAIGRARELELRAISTQTLTSNQPAAALLAKCGFELSGIDTRRRSNHDLVKEAVTLFWYVPLD